MNEVYEVGCSFYLDLEEMGISGIAEVVDIRPCPDDPIRVASANGYRAVTGFFEHRADNVVMLHVEGLEEPIGTTTTHPFFSVDRGWTSAGDLRIGEQIQTRDGRTAYVRRLEPLRGQHTVYNLEVHKDHTFYVSSDAAGPELHVHNSCLKEVLKNFRHKAFQFGEHKIRFTQNGLRHILVRHHPRYWNGTVRQTQSFLPRTMKPAGITKVVQKVLKQNAGQLRQGFGQVRGQVRGVVDGVEYVVGMRGGRVQQLYPVLQ